MRHGEHGRTSKALRRFPKLSLQLLRFSTTRLSKSSSDKRFAACLASASSTLIGPTGVMHALMQLPRLTDAPLLCLDLLHNPSGFYLECRRFNTRTGAKTSSLGQKPLQLHVLASNAVGGLTSFPFTVFRSRHTYETQATYYLSFSLLLFGSRPDLCSQIPRLRTYNSFNVGSISIKQISSCAGREKIRDRQRFVLAIYAIFKLFLVFVNLLHLFCCSSSLLLCAAWWSQIVCR